MADADADASQKTAATVVLGATAVCPTAVLLTVIVTSTAPPLTLTAKPFLASVSTLPSGTGIEFPTDIYSLPASFSPLWLHRPAPPYCGASHTNDRKATGSCLQRPLPPFGGTSQLLVGLPQVVHAHFNQLAEI